MNNLTIIEQEGQRVLTTAQLAESYGATDRKIVDNFNNNKTRYKEGKHFILLSGNELKEFKSENENFGFASNLNKLYLWTEKGAWLHAKSLNTDKAWDAYEMLVDEYYALKKNQPLSQSELILMMAQQNVDLERRQKELELKHREHDQKLERIETKQENITEIISLNSDDWRNKIKAIISKISHESGKKYAEVYSESHKVLEDRAKCKLTVRVNNRKKDLALAGASKTKQNNVSKLDIIEDDKRLLEIYLAVVKEMAIKYSIDVSEMSF